MVNYQILLLKCILQLLQLRRLPLPVLSYFIQGGDKYLQPVWLPEGFVSETPNLGVNYLAVLFPISPLYFTYL